jgi:fused signal recognition particle receptor
MTWLDKFKQTFSNKKDKKQYLEGLKKSRDYLSSQLDELFQPSKIMDDSWLDDILFALVSSDVSIDTASKIIELFKSELRKFSIKTADEAKNVLIQTLIDFYGDTPIDVMMALDDPTVILIVGVNGVGKTTSIAKLANKYKSEGLNVGLVAADTFRAGAIDQLRLWAEKINVKFYHGNYQEDPSSVLVDALRKSKQDKIDILLCDTAGRLTNKTNLMNELAKMFRVMDREISGAPHAIWLVLDATIGQNGINQAKQFIEATEVGGIILTKLDGSSKGGVVLSIKDQLGIKVLFVGLGEKEDDLRSFNPESYFLSLFGDSYD